MRPAALNVTLYPDRNIEFSRGQQHMTFKRGDRPPWYEPRLAKAKYIGQPKGVKQILWERGLWNEKLSLDGGKDKIKSQSARHLLSIQPDFMAQKSQLEELVLERGFSIDMTPKYHCELVALERRWGRSKWYCRCHCKYNYAALLKVVPHSLISEEVKPIQLLRKYFRKSRDYMETYRVGVDAGHAKKL